MKRFIEKIKSFFFPAPGAPTWVKILPYAALGLVTIILFAGAGAGWEYTNLKLGIGTKEAAKLEAKPVTVAGVKVEMKKDKSGKEVGEMIVFLVKHPTNQM